MVDVGNHKLISLDRVHSSHLDKISILTPHNIVYLSCTDQFACFVIIRFCPLPPLRGKQHRKIKKPRNWWHPLLNHKDLLQVLPENFTTNSVMCTPNELTYNLIQLAIQLNANTLYKIIKVKPQYIRSDNLQIWNGWKQNIVQDSLHNILYGGPTQLCGSWWYMTS